LLWFHSLHLSPSENFYVGDVSISDVLGVIVVIAAARYFVYAEVNLRLRSETSWMRSPCMSAPGWLAS
jgi:hypothetical protein